jgi:hypothetical protein
MPQHGDVAVPTRHGAEHQSSARSIAR